jgi:hypothetical protein
VSIYYWIELVFGQVVEPLSQFHSPPASLAQKIHHAVSQGSRSIVLNNPTLFIDLLLAIWILLVSSVALVLLPSWVLRTDRHLSPWQRAAHGFIRMLCLVILGTLLWARLGLFTWFTALLTYSLSLFVIWLFGNNRHPQHKLQSLSQNILALVIDLYDRGISLKRIGSSIDKNIRQFRRSFKSQIRSSASAVSALALILAALFTLYLRFNHPLSEFRFSLSDSYNQLLATQQILSRDVALFDAPNIAIFRVPVLAAIVSFLSVIAGVDAIHAQHFTMAIVGCWLVVALGYCLFELTASLAASAVGVLGLGAYLFTWTWPLPAILPERIQQWLNTIISALNLGWVRQWNPNEVEVAALFLLLGLGAAAQISKNSRRLDGWISAICCWLVVSISAPQMLILLLAGGFGMILGRRVALFAVAITWLALALLSAIPDRQLFVDPLFLRTLPIDLSLLWAMLFVLSATALQGLLGIWTESVGLIVIFAVSINLFWPGNMTIDHVEYDVAARKTAEISMIFPYKNWTLVAPGEQLAQSYRQGWYEDLSKFVASYQGKVQKPAFRIPIRTANIFVMVEKRPFGADRPEVEVPYSTLNDPFYQNYRSPQGRSRLQKAAMELCITYAQNHPDSRTYYEDAVIKIFQFSGLPPSNP